MQGRLSFWWKVIHFPKIRRNVIAAAVCIVLVSGSLAWMATRPDIRADGSAQPEVIPTAAQQKIILDLMEERTRYNREKDVEISGAAKMLASQLVDPVTKQVGLDPQKWAPVLDNKTLKFIQVPQSLPTAPQSPSPQ